MITSFQVTETIDRIAAACRHCNGAKGDATYSVDFETSNYAVSLFNPRRHVWSEHFEDVGAGNWPRPKTAIGRATANLLWKSARSSSSWSFEPWRNSAYLPQHYRPLFDELNRDERVHDHREFDVTRAIIRQKIENEASELKAYVQPYLMFLEGNRYKNRSRITDFEKGRRAFEIVLSYETDNYRLRADAHNGLSNIFTQASTYDELLGGDPTVNLIRALHHQDKYISELSERELSAADVLYIDALKYRRASIVARIRKNASQEVKQLDFDERSYASADASRWGADLSILTSETPRTALEKILDYLDRQIREEGIFVHAKMTASAYLERRRLFLLYFLDAMPEARLHAIVKFYGVTGMHNEFRELILAFMRPRRKIGSREIECLIEAVDLFRTETGSRSGQADRKVLGSIELALKKRQTA